MNSKRLPEDDRNYSRLLDEMSLRRTDGGESAGLLIVSLPWPEVTERTFSLGERPTYTRSLGCWPRARATVPRRLLMIADGMNEAPSELKLTGPVRPSGAPPTAMLEMFARSDDPFFIWENHRVRIRHNNRSLVLAMGLRTGAALHWWEACRLVELEQTANCRIIEIGGAIPLVRTVRDFSGRPVSEQKYMHKHNWLYGHVQMRLHANGVCEVFAHHINGKYVDNGADLAPAVPVIGLWTDDPVEKSIRDLSGPWDGSRERFELGQISFDAGDVARLATPAEPGRIDWDPGTNACVWQPYLGCSWFGGCKHRSDDGYVVHGGEQKIPRGMARTLRFSFSFCDRSPHIARYMAPPWWYALCAEFQPEPLLPVFSAPERLVAAGRKWLRGAIRNGGFEDGALARGDAAKTSDHHPAPGWEGEIPYAQFLTAWRYSDGEEHDLAMRTTYHFADVVVDHASDLVRSKGFTPPAFALPMNRVQGLIAGFLETGDDYLLETAMAVVETANRTHRKAWPRMAVGRDAAFWRSAMLLYRYFNNEHFRQIAYQGAIAVAATQRANGSFGDQGGGSGIHQWPGYITKPWMGLLAMNCVLDYLEMFPAENVLLETVRRFADWLMAERVGRNGVRTWAYQHDYDGKREFKLSDGKIQNLPGPDSQWHHETLARLLGYAAFRFKKPEYLEAWAESHGAVENIAFDHAAAAAFQFLPWLQAKLFQATLDKDGRLQVKAWHFGPLTPAKAKVLAPAGEIELAWTDDKTLKISGAENIPSGTIAGHIIDDGADS